MGHIQVHQHTQWKSQKKRRETEGRRKAENSQDVIKDMNLYGQEAQPLRKKQCKKDPLQDT